MIKITTNYQWTLTTDGRITQQEKLHNIITSKGLEEIAKRSNGRSTTTNDYMAIGTDDTAPNLNDTALGTQVAIKTMGVNNYVDGNPKEIYTTIFVDDDTTETLPNIKEAGIFTAATNGILISHVTTTKDWIIGEHTELTVYAEIVYANA